MQVTPDAVFHALTTQKIELVLTAHPTEVNRRTYLNKHKKARVHVICKILMAMGLVG